MAPPRRMRGCRRTSRISNHGGSSSAPQPSPSGRDLPDWSGPPSAGVRAVLEQQCAGLIREPHRATQPCQSTHEGPELSGLELGDRADEPRGGRLGSATHQRPSGIGQCQHDAPTIDGGANATHEAPRDEPTHDRGNGALPGVGTRGEIADRRSGGRLQLLEQEELGVGYARPLLDRARRLPQRADERPQAVEYGSF